MCQIEDESLDSAGAIERGVPKEGLTPRGESLGPVDASYFERI